MARDVVLQATYADLAGDETYELWLKNDGLWILALTGDVEPVDGTQDFTLLTLTAGSAYVAQIRLKRAGRYRTGYLTANPDSWPSGSRCEFTPGALVGVGAPVVNSAVWARTSGLSQKITLTITPDDEDVNITIYRDGVAIAVVDAPLTSPFTYDDVNPTIAQAFSYYAAHSAPSGLIGPVSSAVPCFSGPLPPDDVAQSSDITDFAFYDIDWDADSDPVRLQDDFLCDGIYANQIGGGGTTTASTFEVNKEDHLIPIDGEQSVLFHARVRREVSSFAVVDVSDWVQISITMHIETTNTAYHSCP